MHINLIYEEEQRSSSPVSLALVIRLCAVVVVVLIVSGFFSFYGSFNALQNKVRAAEDEWKNTEPQYKAAVGLRNDLAERNVVLGQVKGWRDSRIEWGKQLASLPPVVPAVIQLTELRVSHTVLLLSNNISARVFEMKISGKTAAVRSEVNVMQFLEAFKLPPFAGVVQSAVLPPGAFRQDTVSKADRIFEIVCKYHPRALE